MNKCSHKVPLEKYCPDCDREARKRGLDRETQERLQAEKDYTEWCREINYSRKR